jgi:hypothetical protein
VGKCKLQRSFLYRISPLFIGEKNMQWFVKPLFWSLPQPIPPIAPEALETIGVWMQKKKTKQKSGTS